LEEVVANNCKERQKDTTLAREMIEAEVAELGDKAEFLFFKRHGLENLFDKSIINAVNFEKSVI